MQVVMVMFRADGEQRSFSVTRDVTVIGRREDCDLRIPLGDVSRKHCRVIRDGETISLEDLGSSNGTFVNGQRVQESVVTAGDTVQIGPVIFCVQIDGVPAEEDMVPVFTAPAAVPAYDEAGEVPLDAPAELVAGSDGVTAAEGAVEELTEDEPALEVDDFEEVTPLEAGSAAPIADTRSDTPGDSVGAVEEVFVEDEAQVVDDEMASETEEEVVLGDFDIIDDDDSGQASHSGDVPIDTNRH